MIFDPDATLQSQKRFPWADMRAWINNNWERCFLFLIALIFLAFSIQFFFNAEVTGATAAFGMFFLCLIYANVSRFKRFKGLGKAYPF